MSRPASTLVVLLALSFGACARQTGTGAATPRAPAPGPEEGFVRPGDRLELRIFEEPDMSGEYPVDLEGRVVLPKVGSVQVSRFEVLSAADSLRARLSEYLRNPSVDVRVLRRIGVHGEVRSPGLFWVDLTMSLRDAVGLAQGVTDEGNPGRLLLVRGDEASELEGYERWALLDVGIASGDQIVVPRRSWASLNMPFIVSTFISVLSLAVVLIAR